MTTATLEQRTEALIRGNRVRTGRSLVKAELKALSPQAGRERLAQIIEDGVPVALGQMYCFELLMLAPRLGESAMRRVLKVAGVDPLRRAGALTPRQKKAMAETLRVRGRRS